MNTSSIQTDTVEASPSTSSTSTTATTTTPLPLSHSSNVIRITDNNNNSNQTATKSIRRFSCNICNIDFLNQKNFNSHLNSRQHQQAQSVHDVLQSVSAEYRPAYRAMFSPEILNKKVFNRHLRCDDEIRESKSPLLGLNYIIEFQFENSADSAQYVCELCHCKCSSKSILSHISSIQHQRQFLKIHHPEMYERVLSASTIRSEQHRLIENYAKLIHSRHGGPGQIQLHVQLDSFIGQKAIVLAVAFKSQSGQNSKGSRKPSIQLTSRTFEEYDYAYVDEPNITEDEKMRPEQIVNNHESSIQWGLTQEDLLYPFDRQFWHRNYKELVGSRPLDPHAVTYQEIIPDSSRLQPFQGVSGTKNSLPLSITTDEKHLTLENGQTIRRNTSQSSNRRVILDSDRTPTIANNGILQTSPTKNKPNFDGYTLLNAQQKKPNGTHAVLNEQSARAILAASGLLRSDEEDEQDMRISHQSSMKNTEEVKKKSEQTVSPAIAKRMLDAVLNGELDVVHIQPYFSTFVNLIQTGQVELERHQAERLLHKVLVTSSPIIKNEPVANSKKRTRSRSRSKERHSSSTDRPRHCDEYRSSTESNPKRHSSTSTTNRRVHFRYENKTTNGK